LRQQPDRRRLFERLRVNDRQVGIESHHRLSQLGEA
jgi:hypothetical protein